MDKTEINNEEFKNKLMYQADRPSSIDEIKSLASTFFESENICTEYRFSSLVVYIYKCIETNDIAGVQRAISFGQQEIKNLLPMLNYPKDGIRDDPVQVTLSYYTAAWHASILIGKSPVDLLEKIRVLVNGGKLYKASYSQNVGRSQLLLAYIYFNSGEESKASSVISDFYKYFTELCNKLRGEPPVGSTSFGDITKCINALHCALGGLEWIRGKRKLEKLWNKKKVFQLTSRISTDIFRLKFMKDPLLSYPPTQNKMVCIGIRYSLFSPGAAQFHTSSSDIELYQKNLFSSERLSARFEIFKRVTLPSLVNMDKNSCDNILVVIAISESMPNTHKKELKSLLDEKSFIVVVEQNDHDADINSAMKLAISDKLCGQRATVASVRLDDDDALSISWIEKLSELLKVENIGNTYSFPKGLTAFYDSESSNFIGILNNYSKNIALGLSHISYFDGYKMIGETVYALGNGGHMSVPSQVVDVEEFAYLRVINSFRDKNYKAGSNSNRLKKDFYNYLSKYSRSYEPLDERFNIHVENKELDVFVATAEFKNDKIEVKIEENTLSRRFKKYEMACYFYSGEEILQKTSYRAGPKFVLNKKNLTDVDSVKVFIKNSKDHRKSMKISVIK